MADTIDEPGDPRVIPFGTDPPRLSRRRRAPRGSLAVGAAVLVTLGFAATTSPSAHLDWQQGVAPQERLNAASIISTPTGFSILGGLGETGVVWSTSDGRDWISRTLPRLSSRIAFHRRGLFVVDRREVFRIGPDGDDPTALIELPDVVRIGNGSDRSGLMAALDGLLAQTVRGDLYWSPDGRTFDLAVEAARWGADSDVTPRPPDVSEVAPDRVRSVCRPRARRAPDVPPMVVAEDQLVAMIPEHDPSVVWPVCEPVLWASPDGSSWVPLTGSSPFPDGAYVYDMAWRTDRFVAVGGIGFDNAMVWTSLDGRRWERIDRLTPPIGVDLTDVEAGGLGWIIVGDPRDGSDKVGWYSDDGSCWEPLPDGVAGSGIAVGNDLIVLVGGDPSMVWVGSALHTLSPVRACL